MANTIGFRVNNIVVYIKDAVARLMGLPAGGTAGQILKKNSATDYDAVWEDENGGLVTVMNPITSISNDTVTKWVEIGNGLSYFNQATYPLHNQPARYGFLLTIISNNTNCFQIWFPIDETQKMQYRMGNISRDWFMTFKEIDPDLDFEDITGLAFDGSTVNQALSKKGTWEQFGKVFYGTCSTAAATAAKTTSITGFTTADLVTGTVVIVKFTYANTNSAPTLNVSSTGAKNIKAYGTTAVGNAADINGWYANSCVAFVYDGTYWVRLFIPVTGGIQVRPNYVISTTDLEDGVSALATGKIHFYYEA